LNNIDLIQMQVNITALATSLQMRLSTIENRKELTDKQKAVRDDLKALVILAWEAKDTAKSLEEEFHRVRRVAFNQEAEVVRLTKENEELRNQVNELHKGL